MIGIRIASIALATTAALLASARAGDAAVVYSYATDAATYDAGGGSASVHVFLKETLTGGSTSVIAGDGGLGAAGFRLQVSAGSGVQVTAETPASGFGGLSSSTGIPGTNVGVNVTKAVGQAAPSPDASGLIPLATLTFAPTGAGGQGATFSLTREDATGTNTLTLNHLYNLDADSASPAFTGVGTTTTTFAVNTPEPICLAGAACIAAAAILRRRPRLYLVAAHSRAGKRGAVCSKRN